MKIDRFIAVILLLWSSLTMAQIHKEGEKLNGDKEIFIGLKMDNTLKTDTFTLSFYQNVIDPNRNSFSSQILQTVTMDENGSFNFRIKDIASPGGYIILNKLTNNIVRDFFGNPANSREVAILDMYFVEPGDNIKINMKKDSIYLKSINLNKNLSVYNYGAYDVYYQYPAYSVYFTGIGSEKYKCRYEADRITSSIVIGNPVVNSETGELFDHTASDILQRLSVSLVDDYKMKMSHMAYNILKADFLGIFELERIKIYRMVTSQIKENPAFRTLTLESYQQKLNKLSFGISDSAKFYSSRYSLVAAQSKLLGVKLTDSTILTNYYLLKSQNKGILRDKILANYILIYSGRMVKSHLLLDDALQTIKNRFCLNEILKLKSGSEIGQIAYNFSLPDSTGKIVRLSDFKGKTVFMDFWYEACGACINYYEHVLSKVEERFRNNKNVVFVSVNIDKDKKAWIRSIKDGRHTSPSFINLNTGGNGVNDPTIKHYQVFAYPRPLLIDKNGNIFSSSTFDLISNGVAGLEKKIDDSLEK